MTTKSQTVKLKAGTLLEEDNVPIISKQAALRTVNDINKLPSYEILRRLYGRHKTGLWQGIAITTWLVIGWQLWR